MLRFTQGNLLDAKVEAIVNTVNTVGVMGKGIALMFKERFPENFKAYEAACKRHEVRVGQMFVTEALEISGPRWIINFPTKKHWRQPSQLEWIIQGLQDLRRVLIVHHIHSAAIPPLGSGNGGLAWPEVRAEVERSLNDLPGIEVVVYEPTAKYQNVAKGRGVEKLTPARAMIAEMIWRYGVLGLECSIIEVQKLAWVLTRILSGTKLRDPLKLTFVAEKYGPYTHNLKHLLDALDGSFLHCEKRVADASPFDTVRFDPEWRVQLNNFFASSDGAPYLEIVDKADEVIDGFQSPLGMEALATVDWLVTREHISPTLESVHEGLKAWPGGAGERKERLFKDKVLNASLERIKLLPAVKE